MYIISKSENGELWVCVYVCVYACLCIEGDSMRTLSSSAHFSYKSKTSKNKIY